jgi:hypothetical protein
MQRAYLRAVPDTPHLSWDGLPPWEPVREPPLSPELQALLDRWNADLGRAVNEMDEARAAFRTFKESITGLDVPLFEEG